MKEDKIYLDYAASTPVDKAVLKAMKPYFKDEYGNPGSIHSFGQKANAAIDQARSAVADELGVEFDEVVFTASASEANDLIIDGIFEGSGIEEPKIIISDIEHESVSQTADNLVSRGAQVVRLPVSQDGFVDPDELRKLLDEKTILVSVIHGSNEIGTIQPLEEIGNVIESFRKERGLRYPLLHTDAVQTLPFMKIDTHLLKLDALTLSSQKIYGSKGAGALFISKDFLPNLRPQLVGGGHEFGLRASTPNVPAIVGFGKAVEIVAQRRGEEGKRLMLLRDKLLKGLQTIEPNLEVNGSMQNRLPGNLSIYFPGRENEDLVIKFDMVGVAVSSGSACSVKATKVARSVLALGYSEERAASSIRFTLGEPTTTGDIDQAVKRAEKVLVR
ncbi:MAG: cysteine desulfurase family protein [bacterium]|nr:cysteine desulfurase family protein [bacterium]MDZ4231565.1 cysteine desulfurase family protein [Patescibacteria group bacterium]